MEPRVGEEEAAAVVVDQGRRRSREVLRRDLEDPEGAAVLAEQRVGAHGDVVAPGEAAPLEPQEQPEAAEKRFNAALERVPDNPTALMGLAKITNDRGDYNASIALLERARTANPKAVRPRLVLAEYHLRRAVERSRVDEGLSIQLMTVLRAVGKHDEAVAHARQVLVVRPDYERLRRELELLQDLITSPPASPPP